MEDDWMAMMLQFADSTLPVGGYAHSFGLEGLVQAGMITQAEDLRRFLLRDVRNALVTVEVPLMLRSFQAILDSDWEEVARWDQIAWAMRPTEQLREAAGRIGRQTWLLYQKTWRVFEDGSFPRHQTSIVSGVIFAERGTPPKAAFWTIVYQTFSALVQSSLKLLPMGPAAAQAILKEALAGMSDDFERAAALTDEEIGSFNPLWDIAASRHERADARLFIS